MEKDKSDFAYLAFDQLSGLLLTHGPRAIDALDQADKIAPTVPIVVLSAKHHGASIWKCRLTLALARSITDHLVNNPTVKTFALKPIQATWLNTSGFDMPSPVTAKIDTRPIAQPMIRCA